MDEKELRIFLTALERASEAVSEVDNSRITGEAIVALEEAVQIMAAEMVKGFPEIAQSERIDDLCRRMADMQSELDVLMAAGNINPDYAAFLANSRAKQAEPVQRLDEIDRRIDSQYSEFVSSLREVQATLIGIAEKAAVFPQTEQRVTALESWRGASGMPTPVQKPAAAEPCCPLCNQEMNWHEGACRYHCDTDGCDFGYIFAASHKMQDDARAVWHKIASGFARQAAERDGTQ